MPNNQQHTPKSQVSRPYLSALRGMVAGAVAGWVIAWPSEFGLAVWVPLGAFAGAWLHLHRTLVSSHCGHQCPTSQKQKGVRLAGGRQPRPITFHLPALGAGGRASKKPLG